MHLRFSVVAILILSLAACSTEPKAPKYQPPGEQGLTWRLLHPFAKKTPSPESSVPAMAVTPVDAAFQPAPKRSLTNRILHPFSDGKLADPEKKGIKITVEPESTSPSIQATRLLPVRILVNNYTSTMISLTFPTSQRIEIVGRTLEGKIFYTYSTDRSFTNEISVLTVNPGERLEYNETVPTRAMSPGKSYTITASLVGQPGLEGSTTITPVP